MKFVVNGVKYEFDEDRLTFAEAKAVEKATTRTMGDLQKAGMDDAASVQAMVWVTMKRQDPMLKFGDLDDMPISDIEWIPDEPASDEPIPADPPLLADEQGGDPTPSE